MTMLKILHAADLHLDSRFEALSPEKANARRQGQRELLFRMAQAAETHGAQALLLSGDVFDSDDVSQETRRDFCRAMERADIPVFISPGNHDPYFPGSVWERMDLPENVHIFKSEKITCAEFPELNARFWGAGFEKQFCPPLLEDFCAPQKPDGIFDVMVLHGDLSAAKSDYCPITRPLLEKSGMDFVALGHIHMRSNLEFAGKTAFCYPGCPEGRGFDELGEKGCCLITLTESGAEAKFIPLGGVRYEIINVDITGVDPLDAIKNAIFNFSDKDYLRIILTGELEEPLDLSTLKNAFEVHAAEIALHDETTQKRDIWESVGQDTLAGSFLSKLRDMLEQSSTPEEARLIELAAVYGIDALENGGKNL